MRERRAAVVSLTWKRCVSGLRRSDKVRRAATCQGALSIPGSTMRDRIEAVR